MNEEHWISKHSTLLSLLISLLVAVLQGGIVDYHPPKLKVQLNYSNIIFTIFITLLTFLLVQILVGFIKSVFIQRNTLKEDLHKIMHSYPQKLLAKEREGEKSIEDAFRELVKLKDKRGMAFDFAIDSFQKVLSTGFVIFEGDVSKYVSFLVNGIHLSKDYIFATCVVRPFWFLIDPIPDEAGKTVKIGFEKRATHLKHFRDEATKAKKVRIIVLDLIEIALILNDALRNLKIPNSPKSLKTQLSDIPEIEWFTREANMTPNKIELFWAIKPASGLLEEMGDIMIFDGDVALSFKFVNETEAYGHTILSWKSVISPLILKNITQFMRKIDKFKKEEQIKGFNQLIFKSFRALLGHIESYISIEYMEKYVFKDVPAIIKNTLNITTTSTIIDIYKKIGEKLNKGEILFPARVDVTFLDEEGKPTIKRESKWKINWTKLMEIS